MSFIDETIISADFGLGMVGAGLNHMPHYWHPPSRSTHLPSHSAPLVLLNEATSCRLHTAT
jgi:hypothetical protein